MDSICVAITAEDMAKHVLDEYGAHWTEEKAAQYLRRYEAEIECAMERAGMEAIESCLEDGRAVQDERASPKFVLAPIVRRA